MATHPEPASILLVDDYADTLEMWTLYLRSCGYGVLTASDGPRALELARAERPEVIILDLELPGLSGYEVARRLREAEATAAIPLIAVTGYSHAKQIDEASRAGFAAVLVKPCAPAALVKAIEELRGTPR